MSPLTLASQALYSAESALSSAARRALAHMEDGAVKEDLRMALDRRDDALCDVWAAACGHGGDGQAGTAPVLVDTLQA